MILFRRMLYTCRKFVFEFSNFEIRVFLSNLKFSSKISDIITYDFYAIYNYFHTRSTKDIKSLRQMFCQCSVIVVFSLVAMSSCKGQTPCLFTKTNTFRNVGSFFSSRIFRPTSSAVLLKRFLIVALLSTLTGIWILSWWYLRFWYCGKTTKTRCSPCIFLPLRNRNWTSTHVNLFSFASMGA